MSRELPPDVDRALAAINKRMRKLNMQRIVVAKTPAFGERAEAKKAARQAKIEIETADLMSEMHALLKPLMN